MSVVRQVQKCYFLSLLLRGMVSMFHIFILTMPQESDGQATYLAFGQIPALLGAGCGDLRQSTQLSRASRPCSVSWDNNYTDLELLSVQGELM